MHKAAWRRGERQGFRSDGSMFKLCQGCVIAALFHFDATNEGSPRTQCVYYKVPSGSATLPPHQTGACAAVFSVDVSAVLRLRASGESIVSVRLRVPKRE